MNWLKEDNIYEETSIELRYRKILIEDFIDALCIFPILSLIIW